MNTRVRIKSEVGFNRRITLSFGGFWTVLTTACFVFGVADAGGLARTVVSAQFLIAILKALLLLLPIGQVYALLFAPTTPEFKRVKIAGVVITLAFLLILDKIFTGSAVLSWLLPSSELQPVGIAGSLILLLSICEYRIGGQWYSLFYNQRGRRIVMGLLTITSDSHMVGVLTIAGFVGSMPRNPEQPPA